MQARAITVIAVVRSLHIHANKGLSRWSGERRASFADNRSTRSKVTASHRKMFAIKQ